jgi:pyruvate/2-oxoglutarate dehydrogenase complex dihydrolipoamide acyltransferase (E2) component
MENANTDVRLPDLGDVGEVVVVEWLKRVGDAVADGEDLVEVETEKTAFVVPSPARGRLRTITAQPGDRLQAGGALGEIGPA